MLARVRVLYREHRGFRWAVDLGVILAVVLAISAYQTRKHLRNVPLPSLSLRSTTGETVALDSLRGKRSLIYLWAPWCGVCKVETSNIDRVKSMVGDRANVISIAVGYRDEAEVKRYIQERGVTYPVLLGDAAVEQALRVNMFPTIYFVDRDGRIARSVTGYTTTAGLLSRLYLP